MFHVKKTNQFCLKVCVFILLVILTSHYLISKENPEGLKFEESEKSSETEVKRNGQRTLLFWNSYWHWTHFQMGTGNREFKKCPKFSNCYTTTRRSKLRDPNVIIDAVIFHGVPLKLNINEIKQLKKVRQHIPKVNQGISPIFVLFNLVS